MRQKRRHEQETTPDYDERGQVEENPGPVKQYLGGKSATLGFLVGQVMKKSGGQAVPQRVQELLQQELESVRR